MSNNDDNVVSIKRHVDPNADINEMKNFVEDEQPQAMRSCLHNNVLVSEFNRSIHCRHCGATLDAFDYLLSIAKKETRLDWDLRRIRNEIERRREGLENLKREEVNTRARIKNAQFKLHDVNIALEQASEHLIKEKGHYGKR